MPRLERLLLAALLVFGWQTGTFAQRPDKGLPDPAKGYDWKQAAKKAGLSDREAEQLGRDKVLVTDQADLQIFRPYIGGGIPLFITSDSLLNGFHVLYEESVCRLEQTNAHRLKRVLRTMWARLATADEIFRGRPNLVAAAKTRAKATIATAMQLLGDGTGLDGPVGALAKEEAGRVEAAQAQEKPKWLGPPDPGFMALDYRRYKPRGLYAKTPALQSYFRAVGWLQSIPFRLDKDEELAAIRMLAHCVAEARGDAAAYPDFETLFDIFRVFLGAVDDWTVEDISTTRTYRGGIDLGGEGLKQLREEYRDRAARKGVQPQINDQIGLAPADPKRAAELTIRVLGSRRTPDAVLFQRTTDPRKFQRAFPSGLEVCAALGSPFARSQLAGVEGGQLLKEIDGSHALLGRHDLYCAYLHCLAALLAKPEPDAPAFMSAEPWQIKSCQTVLAGWAQLRHTWVLQAKQSVNYLCGAMPPVGFVEPAPEFFGRMAALIERSEAELQKAEAISFDPKETAAGLREAAKLLEQWAARSKQADPNKMEQDPSQQPSLDDMTVLQNASNVLSYAFDFKAEKEPTPAEAVAKLRQLADDLDRGQMPENPWLADAIRHWSADLAQKWRTLERICRQLESMAHKQLRRVAFNDDENQFLGRYGTQLAEVMFYDGESWATPRDDAPRVVDVYSNPNLGKRLLVGIARPRALYVLYPVTQGEILCRGAVMPYYEFTHKAPLTDAEWKSLLDSEKRPRSPDWLSRIIAPGGLSSPVSKGKK